MTSTFTAQQFTREQLVRYAHLFSQYELAKYRYNRETDSRIKAILIKDANRAYNKLVAYRELLGMN
jgi:hypothetical protein